MSDAAERDGPGLEPSEGSDIDHTGQVWLSDEELEAEIESQEEFSIDFEDLESLATRPRRDSTPELYKPNHLGEYTVCETADGKLYAGLYDAVLEKLFVERGDKLRMHEHPLGLLVVPSNEHVDIDPWGPDKSLPPDLDPESEGESDEDPRLGTWDLSAPSPSRESGPIPPEVPWSEMESYRCQQCNSDCLNHEDTDAAQRGECRFCLILWGDGDDAETGQIERRASD